MDIGGDGMISEQVGRSTVSKRDRSLRSEELEFHLQDSHIDPDLGSSSPETDSD